MSLASDLRQSIREEGTAAQHYRSRARIARACGDTATAHLYTHIAGEEDKHAREFGNRLKMVERISRPRH